LIDYGAATLIGQPLPEQTVAYGLDSATIGSLEYDLVCLGSTVASLGIPATNKNMKTKAELLAWAESYGSPLLGLIQVFLTTSIWQKAWDDTISLAESRGLDKQPQYINTATLL
jgi:hypothetical protein